MSDPLLIIEDEVLLANELARFFSHLDWDVQVVGTLARARKLINEETVDQMVILADVSLPDGLVARILHHSGDRAEGPLIEVNCAALPRELAESELFGHEAGAFTGAKGLHRGYLEQADRGTLFLDEIGELDLDLQAKLLTAVEDQKVRRVGGEKSINVDIQIITASNAQLERQVCRQEFRRDLFHRLSVFQISLPALRERIEDLEQLVPGFIEEFNARSNKRIKRIGECNLRQMSQYHWPGNIRELRNAIERAVLLSEGSTLETRWLQLEQIPEPDCVRAEVDGDRVIIPLDWSMALDEMDSYIIQTALERNHQNVTATAKALGTTRETLRYRIQKYQLRSGLGRPPEPEQVGMAAIT